MKTKTLTAQDMIEILSNIDPTTVIAVEQNNPDCTPGTVYTLVESDCVKVEDGYFVLDIS